jgi:choline dehydrogenase-like flavoprotein
MLIQAQTVESGARLEADICVIGTGPAGLTLLKDLSGQGLRIIALESGGKVPDPVAQALCDGATISDSYPAAALMTSRCRQFGGTANLWNDELEAGQGDELVRLVPLDRIDFEERAWVPHSGWPFGKSELEKFYEQALNIVGAVSPGDGRPEMMCNHSELLPLARLSTVLSRFAARTVFTHQYPETLARAATVAVYLNATLLELVTHDRVVSHARVAATPDREFQVAARFFVLAAGGIENARALLLSNRTHRSGLGNQYDLVGRFFMDHPSCRLGVLTPSNRKLFSSAGLYDHHVLNGQPVMGKLTFREETLRQEQMLNICITLTPRGRDYESAAVNVLKQMIRSGSTTAAVGMLRHEFRTLTGGWDELLAKCYQKLARTELVYFENKGGWSRLPKAERRFRRFELRCLCEQAPNPENRVTLANAVDRFGQRKAQLHWEWSEIDLRSIRRAQDILKEEFGRNRLGEFVRQHELDETERPSLATPHHHIGTTRMHIDPRQGVVDPNSRVHQTSNLYVAGSSVFPTGGFANPTLTIIALALRLSYHLKELMKGPVSSLLPAEPTSSPQPGIRR